MGFYNLNKEHRLQLVDTTNSNILADIQKEKSGSIVISQLCKVEVLRSE